MCVVPVQVVAGPFDHCTSSIPSFIWYVTTFRGTLSFDLDFNLWKMCKFLAIFVANVSASLEITVLGHESHDRLRLFLLVV